jgi:hypothetical protein
VIAGSERLPLFEAQLASMGVDVAEALRTRRLILLDGRDTLARIMDGERPSARLFRETIGSVIASATEIWRPARLHAYGELVDLLWADGNPDAALELEDLWNDLAARHAFALFCAYSSEHFKRDEHRAGFDAVCRRHGHILPIEGASSIAV